eukprot:scaffold196117_cov17-Tisochrysis_lutea.AAC.4
MKQVDHPCTQEPPLSPPLLTFTYTNAAIIFPSNPCVWLPMNRAFLHCRSIQTIQFIRGALCAGPHQTRAPHLDGAGHLRTPDHPHDAGGPAMSC